jgi:hypothetical protein
VNRRVRTVLRVVAVLAGWAVVAVGVAGFTLVNSSRATVLLGHDAVVTPRVDGYATFDLGPFLPSFRYPTDAVLGARVDLGHTTAASYDELLQRYAFIASRPDAQIDKLRGTVLEMVVDAALLGALVGLVVPVGWLLLGEARRRELWRATVTPRGAVVVVVALALVGAVVSRPWDAAESDPDELAWEPIAEALPGIDVPERAAPLMVDAGLMTAGTKRLVESAMDSYQKSSAFYQDAVERVPTVAADLHRPEEDQTVAILVSDRHDNIGMDAVARAVADAGGATFLLDAGDDTSTGSPWEAFSLESLDEAFDDVESRYVVSGNHDQGGFLTEQAAELGFTPLLGEPVDGPDGIHLLGAGDPRSSGLGNWRDDKGIGFAETAERLAETACDADADGRRVSTLLVHDVALGRPALEMGCVDLVAAGHLHSKVGPTQVVGANGKVGYSYITGTTGGAAYAIAIGTKPRRDAMVSLVTYEGGRPVGVQDVTLTPLGELAVGAYTPLALTPAEASGGRDRPAARGARALG